jgi:hypothetical protein
MLRGGGLFTFPALLGTAGFLLVFGGYTAESRKPMLYGALCLGGSVVLLLVVIAIRRQGWIE